MPGFYSYEKKRIYCANWDEDHHLCRCLADGLKCKPCFCKFYATRAELATSRTNALKRIATLPEAQQAHISEKYFNGKRPWRRYATPTIDPYTVDYIESLKGE